MSENKTVSAEAGLVDIDLNVIILGCIAKLYSCDNPGASKVPQKLWGAEMTIRSINWNHDLYTVSPFRHEGKAGIRLTKKLEGLNGGKEEENYWFPFDSFESVSLKIGGVRL